MKYEFCTKSDPQITFSLVMFKHSWISFNKIDLINYVGYIKLVVFYTDVAAHYYLSIYLSIYLCLVDGGWSAWSAWSECDTHCGKGTKKRFRYRNEQHS